MRANDKIIHQNGKHELRSTSNIGAHQLLNLEVVKSKSECEIPHQFMWNNNFSNWLILTWFIQIIDQEYILMPIIVFGRNSFELDIVVCLLESLMKIVQKSLSTEGLSHIQIIINALFQSNCLSSMIFRISFCFYVNCCISIAFLEILHLKDQKTRKSWSKHIFNKHI